MALIYTKTRHALGLTQLQLPEKNFPADVSRINATDVTTWAGNADADGSDNNIPPHDEEIVNRMPGIVHDDQQLELISEMQSHLTVPCSIISLRYK
ncbi:hypothetical protein BCON_0079g00100 [Botryotinia convoluta]|uniref:Uncharacterized protein n=1 Tax=Botryotinia convoluta TaxID=54673 RepID=A0A4Z1I4I8_9HELO|nr:hypothetical protein BCON_0079g00100 [Botryotinia convoluta]